MVSIGNRKRPVQPATTTARAPTVIIPSRRAPSPAAFVPKASTSPSQANDLNSAVILRQEQEETVDGYRYL